MSLLSSLLLEPYPFDVWISVRPSKGTGTLNDPYGVTTAADFDALLNSLPANSRIHLGSGIFQTQGYAFEVSGGWQIKPGMKITGSGMEVTMLQLVNQSASEHYFAVGHELGASTLADFAEISDLTIDCNLANAGSSTGCSAVRLMGNHTRISRVKAINWGSKSTNFPCSALSCVTALPSSGVSEVINTGIEACVVVTPGAANVAPCAAIHVGDPDSSFVADGHAKSAYIRNCFVDCGVTTPNPDPATGKFRGLSMGWCRGGVVQGNHVQNADIGGTYQDGKRSARDIIVRNNIFKNVGRAAYWNLGTLAPNVGPGTLARSGTVGTVSGLSDFTYFDVGVRVKIITTPGDYNGLYLIQSKTGTTFTVTVLNSGTSSVEATSVRKVYGVSHAIVEGNVIELAQVSGAVAVALADNNDSSPYSELPDYVHGNVIIRNNRVLYVDGATPNDSGAVLIEAKGVNNLMVQDNVLDTIATTPMTNKRCANATYFNNRTPSGVLLRGWNSDTSQKYGELETDAEDALVLVNTQR